MSAIMVYKQAFQPDVESCFKTCVEALGWEYQPNGRHSDIHDIENTYMRHGCFWCLYENEKLIGMAAVHCIDEESGIAEMKRLYLLPEYQGRGYGGRLFTHALDYAKGQGYKTIRLATRYDRVASLRLIEKNHFQRIVKYDRNEFAELYFELSLNDYKMADHLQKSIDKDVLASYNAGIEINRLHSGLGLIEFERTKEILQETLPPAPAVIYDIGGGYGEYSYWLASLGYEVYLYDLSETNIEMAMVLSRNHTAQLKTMEIADARRINRPDESADAVLLFGPLYHIVNCNERYLALKECYRLLNPKGYCLRLL